MPYSDYRFTYRQTSVATYGKLCLLGLDNLYYEYFVSFQKNLLLNSVYMLTFLFVFKTESIKKFYRVIEIGINWYYKQLFTCHNNSPNRCPFSIHSVVCVQFDAVLVRLPY